MINPLDLLLYIAITVALSVAIGTYIGVSMILSAKIMEAVSNRTGNYSYKPDLFGILTFVSLVAPLVGTGIYLLILTAAN